MSSSIQVENCPSSSSSDVRTHGKAPQHLGCEDRIQRGPDGEQKKVCERVGRSFRTSAGMDRDCAYLTPPPKENFRKAHPNDEIREARRKAKKQAQKRRRARRNFKPEAGEELNYAFTRMRHKVHDLRVRASSSPTPDEAYALAKKILAWKSIIPEVERTTHGNLINVMVAAVSFVSALCACKTHEETRNITIAVLGQHFDYDRVIQVLEYVYDGGLFPQSNDGKSYSAMYKKLESMTLSLADAPCGKFIFNVFSILVMQGFSLGAHVQNDGAKEFLGKIEKDIYAKSGCMNYMECMFSIIEYVAGLADAMSRGEDLRNYIFPECLHTEVIELLASAKLVLSGTCVTDVNTELDSLEKKISSVAAKLKTVLNKRSVSSKTFIAYDRYYERILALQAEVANHRRNLTFRKAPVCYMFYGASQIGKSHLYELVKSAVGVAHGKTYTEEQVASLPELAKYHDVVSNATLVIQMDDVGCVDRSKSDPSESAIATLVGVVQNTTTWTNQSQADKKNTIPFRPELVIGSSNARDLGIKEVFKHPAAAFNRVKIYDVRLLPEYALPDGTLDKNKAKLNTIKGVSPVMHEFRRINWVPVHGDTTGKEYSPDVDVLPVLTPEFISNVTKDTRDHCRHQEHLYQNHLCISHTALCQECGNPKSDGWCQCGGEIFKPEKAVLKFKEEALVETMAFEALDQFSLATLQFSVNWLGNCVGNRFCRFFQNNALYGMLWIARVLLLSFWRLEYLFFRSLSLTISFVSVCTAFSIYHSPVAAGILACVSFVFLYLSLLGYGQAVQCVVKRDVTMSILKMSSRSVLTSSVAVISLLSTGRLIYKMLVGRTQGMENIPESFVAGDYVYHSGTRFGLDNTPSPPKLRAEGNLAPASMEEVEQRKKEESDWAILNTRPLNLDARLRTMTIAQAQNVIGKVLYKISFPKGIKNITCFALFLEDNIAVIPWHVWQEVGCAHPKMKMDRGGSVFSTTFVVNAFHPSGDNDVCFIQLNTAPSMPSLSHMLVDEPYHGTVNFITRCKNGLDLEVKTSYAVPGPIPSDSGKLPSRGMRYHLAAPTMRGDCGSVLLATNGAPRIIGFHCAGDDSGECAATVCTRAMYEEYKMHLRAVMLNPEGDCALPFGETDDVDSAPYDLSMIHLCDIDFRHCTTKYPAMCASGVTVVGYDPMLRSTGYTLMEKGILHTALERAGMPIEYGIPRLNSNRDHAAAFEHKMEPMRDVYPPLLQHAILDYSSGIIEKMRELKWPKKGPASLEVVLNGEPGNRFAGPINETTAAGFGMKGKKTELVDVSYSLVDGRKILTPKPAFKRRYEQSYARVRNGFRLNAVTKTSVKDESVKIDSDGNPLKFNRIFKTRPLDDLAVTKSLFLNVAEVIMSMPFTSECAAGINVTRDDWGQLGDYLTEWGKERIMEGDYSKWDTRLSGQLIRAAGLCFIHIARELGYAECDIVAMNAIISDIATSLVAYNGSICFIDGWVPSGTFLTLLINSAANSLLHRCAFFHRGFEGVNVPLGVKFRDACHLITQGDDSVCACRRDDFSQIEMANYCDSIGIKYTTGDKNIVTERFISADQMTFCKRQWYYNEYIEQWLAPLALSSIDKSLYMHRRGPDTPQQVAIQQVDAALREYARHDEETFNSRKEMLVQACVEIGIDHCIQRLTLSYWDWLDIINRRYFLEEISDEDSDQHIFEI